MSTSRFNLEEYLRYIGLANCQLKPNLDCLNKISLHHLYAFHYQSLALFAEGKKTARRRHIPSLNPDNLFTQLVTNKKSGYCYQNLMLLHKVLSQIGFQLTSHLCTVILENRDELNTDKIADTPVAHMVLNVTIDGKNYLVDPGFGNEALRNALVLEAGCHVLDTDEYWLEEFDDYWQLNSKRYDNDRQGYWHTFYRFQKHAASLEEINMAHQDLYLAKNIPIRTDLLLIADVTERKRKYAYWSVTDKMGLFRSVNLDGTIHKSRKFKSESETVEFAKKKFSFLG